MKTIHLQGLGKCEAVAVEELEPGQVTMWNYTPADYRVVSVTQVSEKFVELKQVCISTGVEYSRRMKFGRLVGINRRAK